MANALGISATCELTESGNPECLSSGLDVGERCPDGGVCIPQDAGSAGVCYCCEGGSGPGTIQDFEYNTYEVPNCE